MSDTRPQYRIILKWLEYKVQKKPKKNKGAIKIWCNYNNPTRPIMDTKKKLIQKAFNSTTRTSKKWKKTLKWNYKPNSGQHHMERNKTSKLNSKVYGFEFKKSMEKSRLKHKKQKKTAAQRREKCKAKI